MKSYKDLRINQDAFELSLRIREESLKLSYPDKFEIGGQIRRSSISIFSNIAEGYGRKKSKAEFIRFLTFSYASTQEAKSQAEFITKFNNAKIWATISSDLDTLGRSIYNFINYVNEHWQT